MKERGILFSAPMVRANLARRKRMTRRLVKPQPIPQHHIALIPAERAHTFTGKAAFEVVTNYAKHVKTIECPYGGPGDRLYVKEASWIWCQKDSDGFTPTGRRKYRYTPVGRHVVYCADQEKPTERINDNPRCSWRYKAARFMPKWACRLWLEVESVRVERVQDITYEDAEAEGVQCVETDDTEDTYWCIEPNDGGPVADLPQDVFACLWDSINAASGHGWDRNDWVWVVAYRHIEQEAAKCIS